jgi:uncharacterized circularly permuted ATP-grasp superfamily protein/uncharacterized alpha-E superfamily protein
VKSGTKSRVNTGLGAFLYTRIPEHWDEALLSSGFPRRHWRPLAVTLGRMGLDQLDRRWQSGRQLIQANGITYNVYGDPQGKERPWLMDPIPMVMEPSEWAYLERAIAQRAMLFNHMLQDLYGERRLIREKHLPAAVLFGNPNFLRPCFGLQPPNGIWLHSYAADLARSRDGKWWVISDRTQAPSGMGYALENRLVSARTLPGAFDHCRVRQLNGFFDAVRDSLVALAPNSRSNPRVVLLTPGPYNETYFEHSFLAKHWGFPLVEGEDLTVRGNRVYLKTLGGLEQVDLIVRRLDDSFCDPLELRGESVLGVPGLSGAVRAGTVAVANALGSGLGEAAAHQGFLPTLCRNLLHEDLLLPSVATWWCGQKEPLEYVLSHLDGLVIKGAFPQTGQKGEFPALMDKAARAALVQRLRAHPDRYVAQEQVDLSTAPVRTEDGLAARHIVVRVFAAWDGYGYTVLPGGLTRVSTQDKSLVVSMQMGGGSKDTWVLGRSKDPSPRPAPQLLPRSTSQLPSRVADNLYWLGRYAERVESSVRLVRALLPGLSGEEDFGRTSSIEAIVGILSGLHYLAPEFQSASIGQQRYHVQQILSRMVYDPARAAGIGWNLKQLRRVSWPLKERLSQDTWRVLQQLETEFSTPPPVHPDLRTLAQMNLLDRAIVILSAFSGLLMENTTRGFGWYFLDIGRRLERAILLADLLRTAIVDAPFRFEPYLEMLLQIADSSITYRSRFLTQMRVEHVLELLLADETNPRSVLFQIEKIENHVQQLPDNEGRTAEMERVAGLLNLVREQPMDDLAGRDQEGEMRVLDELLRNLKSGLLDLSEDLTARYLSHVTPSRLTSSM